MLLNVICHLLCMSLLKSLYGFIVFFEIVNLFFELLKAIFKLFTQIHDVKFHFLALALMILF
jgi:hypothetical protein